MTKKQILPQNSLAEREILAGRQEGEKTEKTDYREKEKREEEKIRPEEAALDLAETPGQQTGEDLAWKMGAPHRLLKRNQEIEKILSQDLEEIYLALPLERQKEFRILGEETAKKINNLLEKTKTKIGEIIALIKKWLAMIPGINNFFLEQEAKIKADRIMKMKNI